MMQKWEQATNALGVFLLVVFVLIAVVGGPALIADNPDGTYTTASGNEVKNTDGLIAVGAVIALIVLSYVLRGKSALLVLVGVVVLLLWAGKVNPQ